MMKKLAFVALACLTLGACTQPCAKNEAMLAETNAMAQAAREEAARAARDAQMAREETARAAQAAALASERADRIFREGQNK